MAGLEIRKSQVFDETRTFDHGKAEIVDFGGGMTAGRFTMEPGWRWSTAMKQRVGTESCEVGHLGYCLSGRMRIVMNDGQSVDLGPGDFIRVPPGHDAWVVGDEPCVMLDFAGAAHYAEAGATPRTSAKEQPSAPAMH